MLFLFFWLWLWFCFCVFLVSLVGRFFRVSSRVFPSVFPRVWYSKGVFTIFFENTSKYAVKVHGCPSDSGRQEGLFRLLLPVLAREAGSLTCDGARMPSHPSIG